MSFTIKNSKKIEPSITQEFYNYSKSKISNIEGIVLESYLESLVILSQKLNLSPSEFHEKLGDYHISELENEHDKSFIDYLKNNSWYGYDFIYLDTNKERQGFNWIELLSPSLQNFFAQAEIDLKTNSHNSQGYILAIDSLVLKFEGLFREFSRMIGVQTIEIKDNSTEERISFDKLLDNEKANAQNNRQTSGRKRTPNH